MPVEEAVTLYGWKPMSIIHRGLLLLSNWLRNAAARTDNAVLVIVIVDRLDQM
jgi:hypothetical protein